MRANINIATLNINGLAAPTNNMLYCERVYDYPNPQHYPRVDGGYPMAFGDLMGARMLAMSEMRVQRKKKSLEMGLLDMANSICKEFFLAILGVRE